MTDKKKSKRTRAGKPADGRGGGGSEPLQVNWYVIGAAILVVGAIVFLSIQQQGQQAAQMAQATQLAGATQTAAVPGALAVGDCQPTAEKWSTAPELTIDTGRQYFANVKLKKGDVFKIQLYPDKAPITVNSFVFLARQGYFNCVTFHRVLEGFMAQGGDPTGTGSGGPGYQVVNESSDLKFDKAGVVAMANAGPDTNGSQFFITFGPTPNLDGGYTIFGQVIEGLEVVNGLTRRAPDQSPTFLGDAMESVTIEEK